MDLNKAIEFLKEGVKISTSLDEFKHIDLTLFPASAQKKAQECFMIVSKAIRDGELTQEEFLQKVGVS